MFTVPNSRSVVRLQRKLAPRPSRRFQFHCLKRPLKLEQVPGTGVGDRSRRSHTESLPLALYSQYWPGETSRVQVKPPKPVGYPVQAPFYTTAVPVNYITSLRVFTDSTSSSTGRIRARFGGSFHSRNRRHRWRRHFLEFDNIDSRK